jgi:hypothetical protein
VIEYQPVRLKGDFWVIIALTFVRVRLKKRLLTVVKRLFSFVKWLLSFVKWLLSFVKWLLIPEKWLLFPASWAKTDPKKYVGTNF